MGKDVTKRRKLTKAERMEVYKKTNGHCAYCGCRINFGEMQAEHVVPLHCGGEDTMDNMLPACRSCNHYKGTSTVERFRKKVESMTGVLMRDSVTYRNAVRFGLVIPRPHRVKFYFEREGEREKKWEQIEGKRASLMRSSWTISPVVAEPAPGWSWQQVARWPLPLTMTQMQF